MDDPQVAKGLWMLDSSTFIHAMIVDRVSLLILLRSPIFFPEYVFRFELGANAKDATRDAAKAEVTRNRIGVQRLTLDDLDRIAALGAPRRIGLGELACAIIAERLVGGILCDDWSAKAWMERRMIPPQWHSIENVLLDAAAEGRISEFDLVDSQRILESNKYAPREDLQLVHLQRQMLIRQGRLFTNGGGE